MIDPFELAATATPLTELPGKPREMGVLVPDHRTGKVLLLLSRQ
jgi:hypothetical protein